MIEALQFICGLAFWSWLLMVLSVIWWVTLAAILTGCKRAGKKIERGEKLFRWD